MQINLANHRNATMGTVVVDIQLFLVNTFTKKVFHGQAVAVCVIKEELNDELLHAIAIENHLPETAFVQYLDKHWQVRWFNPQGEVFSSGHGLLAAAYVILTFLKPKLDEIELLTPIAPTKVYRHQDGLYFDYALVPFQLSEPNLVLFEHLRPKPQKIIHLGPDLLMHYASAMELEQLVVDKHFLKSSFSGALILSAPSEDYDLYVRCFFPNRDFYEETATAAIYPRLATYWSELLGKTTLEIEQGLTRRSEMTCIIKGKSLQIGGYCCCFFQGELMF